MSLKYARLNAILIYIRRKVLGKTCSFDNDIRISNSNQHKRLVHFPKPEEFCVLMLSIHFKLSVNNFARLIPKNDVPGKLPIF